MSMRALKAIRLSVKTDETTSPERQSEVIDAEAKRRGMTVVGEAADLNVSASKTDPFSRPELGQWLTPERAGDYDAIIWWRLDRAVRSMSDLHKLGDWAKRHGKRLVFASGPGGGPMELDMTSPVAELIATILAFAAQMESQATKERVTAAHAYLRREGRWAGGKPPYGYRAVELLDGKGFTLEQDPEPADILRDAVARVIAGEAVNAVCADLNRRGVPSPRDYHRAEYGKPAETVTPWSATSLMKILRSPVLKGYVMHAEKVEPTGDKRKAPRPVPGKDGMPLTRAEPIVSAVDFDRLQAKLDGNAKTKSRTQAASLLLGIVFCECGAPLYKWSKANRHGTVYSYYRCKTRYKSDRGGYCPSKPIRCDSLDVDVPESVLALVGDLEVLDRVFVPGADHTADLKAAESRLRSLRDDRAAGLYDGEEAEYREMYVKVKEQRDRLAALPSAPDRWEQVPTGVTYREHWQTLQTTEERRAFLLRSGVRAVVFAELVRTPSFMQGFPDHVGGRCAVELPPDLQERVRAAA